MKRWMVSLLAICFAAVMFFSFAPNASVEKRAELRIDKLHNALSNESQEIVGLASSSNPYDYIKESKEYQKIVGLGAQALPVLERRITHSAENGLFEYLLAVAMEEIAKVDLKKDSETAWTTGKEFAEQWRVKLKQIPEDVNHIINATQTEDEKNRLLIDLGIPAVPFISEKVEEGATGVFPALIQITEGQGAETSNTAVDAAKWVQKNKARFEELKTYVLSFSS